MNDIKALGGQAAVISLALPVGVPYEVHFNLPEKLVGLLNLAQSWL